MVNANGVLEVGRDMVRFEQPELDWYISQYLAYVINGRTDKRVLIIKQLVKMKRTLLISMLLLIAVTSFASRKGIYCFFKPGTGLYEDAHLKVAIVVNGNNAQLAVYNKTANVIYLDKGNSFVYKNNEPVCLFQNSSYTSGKSSESGATVNLGSVASALGIGGVIGTIASGVNVGGGNSIQNATTTYEQRVLAIAPNASYVIYNWTISEYDIRFSIPKSQRKKGNNWTFEEYNSPCVLKTVLKYSTREDFAQSEQITMSTFVGAIVVDSYKGVKHRDLSKTNFCNQFRGVPFYCYTDGTAKGYLLIWLIPTFLVVSIFL